jgi:hypothetical protein
VRELLRPCLRLEGHELLEHDAHLL